jgi:hypothetical protein
MEKKTVRDKAIVKNGNRSDKLNKHMHMEKDSSRQPEGRAD